MVKRFLRRTVHFLCIKSVLNCVQMLFQKRPFCNEKLSLKLLLKTMFGIMAEHNYYNVHRKIHHLQIFQPLTRDDIIIIMLEPF